MTIHYTLTDRCSVSLELYTMSGRLIERLEQADKPAGSYQLSLKAEGHSGMALPVGTYIVQMTTNSLNRSVKVVIQ